MPAGRPKNAHIESSNKHLVAVMHAIEQKLFFKNEEHEREKELYDTRLNLSAEWQRSLRLSELAKQNGIKLNAVQLKKRLIRPFFEKRPITLSQPYLKNLYALLKLKIPEINFTEAQLKQLENFKREVIDGNNLPTNPTKADVMTHFLTSDTWLLFERIGDIHIKDKDFGIAVGHVIFSLQSNQLRASVSFNYEATERVYTGEVTFDLRFDYLYMNLKLESTGKQAFIALRLESDDVTTQTVMLGHFSYHSRKYEHLLSKAVVLQKQSSVREDIKKGDHSYNSEEYLKISAEITKFLYPRDKNRLSLPRITITTLDDLKSFLDSKGKKANPVLRKHFQGIYKVFYKSSKGVLIEDELEILFNENSRLIEAKYIHRPDISKANNKNYKGQVFLNQKFIVLELSETQKDTRRPEEDPILLAFQISDEDINYNECECFPGLLSGLQDSSREPYSFICLVVRKEKENLNGYENIENYFNAVSQHYLTPYNKGFKLNNLL